MKQLKEQIKIIRVQNGWIVRDDADFQPTVMIATTPYMLAELLQEWARAQERKKAE
jgi:hypothetical protein